MGYSQKLYPDEECPEKVTVRVLPEKKMVYPRFRDLVTKELGSDVCFVTSALWEAFLIGMDRAVPQNDEQLEIKFLRQNVQINIGCNINYQPRKARRYPKGSFYPAVPPATSETKVTQTKNHFLPTLLDEWGTLGEKQKQYWRERMIEMGIIPKPRKRKPAVRHPSVSTGTTPRGRSSRQNKTPSDSMTNVVRFMTIKGAAERLRGFGRRLWRRLK